MVSPCSPCPHVFKPVSTCVWCQIVSSLVLTPLVYRARCRLYNCPAPLAESASAARMEIPTDGPALACAPRHG
ncbi:hypothetical protein EYF80_051473 [Liparis tanakae]|uniref:Uncharacterized protein n=1 Tax=Liparis tanakae TaxID=230148 RepID=A0A4Z2FBR0_9TELE|nr:hypothetical protein EYF80_051473 [Liparis tanakae]